MVKSGRKKITIATICSIFFFSFIAVIVQASYKNFTEVINEKWSERGEAYDIKSEYNKSIFLSFIRTKLLEVEFDPNGFILASLQRWHGDVYNDALRKIPENDIERSVLWRQYILFPSVVGQNDLTFSFDDFSSNLKLLNDGQAKSIEVDKVDRLLVLTDLLNSYRLTVAKLNISRQQMEELDNLFLETSIKTFLSVDMDYVFSKPRRAQILLQYTTVIQEYIAHLFFRRQHDTKSCPERLAKSWIIITDKSKEIIQLAKKLNFDDKSSKRYEHLIETNLIGGTPLILKYYPMCKIILGDKNG